MNICLLTIGDELLEGIIRNSNAEWLATELWATGMTLKEHVTVADQAEDIVNALRRFSKTADLCVVSGGLGPTPDDLTIEALATMVDDALVTDEAHFQRLVQKGLGRDRGRHQSRRPESAQSFDNPEGHAPFIVMSMERCTVVALPGVPQEFRSGARTHVLSKFISSSTYAAKTLSCLNLGETRLYETVKTVGISPGIDVRYQAAPPYTHLRLRSLDSVLLNKTVEALSTPLSRHLIPYTGEALMEQLKALLERSGLSIGCAESCTAGMIASQLGHLPGSSKFLLGGIVSYSNQVKTNTLGVSANTLVEFGAVSERCALEMAEGVCRVLGSDIGLSVTGIAGPGGGSMEKPVGTVCFAWSVKGKTITETVHFRGKRTSIRQASTVWSLNRCMELLSARV